MKKMSRRRKVWLIVLGSFALLLILVHIMLPWFLLRFVNRQLARIDGYTGHVEDIDVNLFRGAYTIQGIKLDKTGGQIPVPFFHANQLDISIEWRALFNGRIVAEIEVDRPMLNFVKGPSKESSQTEVDKEWTDVVDKLIPFKLNRFEILKGEVHYRDYHSSPKVDLVASNLHVIAENLSNAKHAKDSLPSNVKASADVYDGKVTLDMKLDALSKEPAFDMNAKMTTLNLVKLNDFLKAYGNFDVEKGTISLYTEAAAKNNHITGYTKPVIKDMKVSNWKEDKDNLGKIVWESVIEAVAWILNNKKKDQIATRAEFTGRLDDPNVNTWYIIGQLLRNAFIQALYPSLENSVNLNTVGKEEDKHGLLERIFKKNESGQGQKEETRKEKRQRERKERKEKRAEKK